MTVVIDRHSAHVQADLARFTGWNGSTLRLNVLYKRKGTGIVTSYVANINQNYAHKHRTRCEFTEMVFCLLRKLMIIVRY